MLILMPPLYKNSGNHLNKFASFITYTWYTMGLREASGLVLFLLIAMQQGVTQRFHLLL